MVVPPGCPLGGAYLTGAADAALDAGTVILGGPFPDASGSMVILTVESEAAARTLYQDDPWVQQDVLVPAEVKEWTIFLDGRAKTLE